jgi:hypothetical protein
MRIPYYTSQKEVLPFSSSQEFKFNELLVNSTHVKAA